MKKIAVATLLGGAIISAGLTACTSLPAAKEGHTVVPTVATAAPVGLPAPAPEVPVSNFTAGQENAIESAESYLSFTSFSRSGLIHQLEFEQFSTADATFAVDHVTVDWNEQAVKSAKSYLEFTSLSKQRLIDQLEFEGFTPAQAQYGANAAYGS